MIAAGAYLAYQKYQQQQQQQQQLDDELDEGGENAVAAMSATDRVFLTGMQSVEEASTHAMNMMCHSHTGGYNDDDEYEGVEEDGGRAGAAAAGQSSLTGATTSATTSATTAMTKTRVWRLEDSSHTTTFRDDIRREWIHAVFGTNGRTDQQASSLSSLSTSRTRTGVGLAGIPSYAIRIVDIPPPLTTPTRTTTPPPSSSFHSYEGKDEGKDEDKDDEDEYDDDDDEKKNTAQRAVRGPTKLGLTLSRLSLGLYVRSVQPGSVAACAGVQPNSILVGIYSGGDGNGGGDSADSGSGDKNHNNHQNNLNLLAEPSHRALERLWMYEGQKFGSPEDPQRNGGGGDNNNDTTMIMDQPIQLVLMLRSQLYTALLLSPPHPFGIEWAPCGNFCLIQKVAPQQRAALAGIRPSALIVSVDEIDVENSEHGGVVANQPNSNYSSFMDYTTASTALQQRSSSSGGGVRLTLAFPPTAARSGHWERRQQRLDEEEEKAQQSNENKNGGKSRELSKKASTTTTSNQSSLPAKAGRLVASLDGVQIRVHPLFGGGGSSSRSNNNNKSSNRNNHKPLSYQRQQQPSSSTTLPPIVGSAPGPALSQRAARVAAGEVFFGSGAATMMDHGNTPHSPPPIPPQPTVLLERRVYRPCPILSHKQLLQAWDGEAALVYLMRYDLAGYNERELSIKPDQWQLLPLLRSLPFLTPASASNNDDDMLLSTFLLPCMAWMTNGVIDHPPLTLTQYILQRAQLNVTLSHRMELLAVALDNPEMKKSCTNLRAYRKDHWRDEMAMMLNKTVPGSKQPPVEGDSNSIGEADKPTTHPTTPVSPLLPPLQSTIPMEAPLDAVGLDKPPRRLFGIFRKKKKKNKRHRKLVTETSTVVVVTRNSANQNVSAKNSPTTVIARPDVQQHSKSLTVPTSPPDQSTSATTVITLSPYLKAAAAAAAPAPLKDKHFDNLLRFLQELESITNEIEQSLMKSFSQMFARWALQPWTPSKETALAQVTHAMREHLKRCNLRLVGDEKKEDEGVEKGSLSRQLLLPMVDPIDSNSPDLRSIDTHGCYILPSAHFPLLLTFEADRCSTLQSRCRRRRHDTAAVGQDQYVYRTVVELVELRGSRSSGTTPKENVVSPRGFTVHGSVSGAVVESERSTGIDRLSNKHVWDTGNILVFETRSSWGPPTTLSLRVSEAHLDSNGQETLTHSDAKSGKLSYSRDCGYGWIDMASIWADQAATAADGTTGGSRRATMTTKLVAREPQFDEHGDLIEVNASSKNVAKSNVDEEFEVEVRVTTKVLDSSIVKRSLLYKHDDDVRQELFAIEFIKSCDRILTACGLDMKMLTFRCIPVGKRSGFIEWVEDSVPLSEICQPFAGSFLGNGKKETTKESNDGSGSRDGDDNTLSSVARAGLAKYESLRRIDRGMATLKDSNDGGNNTSSNPIQDFLRSFGYDADAPYCIKRDVMDTYIKSCAGYTVCTYLLGVGDRHLDNLLLHPSGHFFHCDYSFILGQDPKKYLPMRITDDMVRGMGGRDSDLYCQFLNLASAVFLTLRRPENVRALLSMLRLMDGSGLPSVDVHQTMEAALAGLRGRLRLDLNDDEAITFMETLIEDSCTSKLWLAVDAMHSLGKRF